MALFIEAMDLKDDPEKLRALGVSEKSKLRSMSVTPATGALQNKRAKDKKEKTA